MKNNNNSEKKKNAKGFYTALGISALMIGSACYFAYSEGEQADNDISSYGSQFAVDRKETDIPKVTTTTQIYNFGTPVNTTTYTVTTVPATETKVLETIPAAVIPDVVDEPVVENVAKEQITTYRQPLKNTLNIINMFSGEELVKNATTGSWQTHNGMDIKAEIGDDVFAIADGTVKTVEDDPLWGTVVTLELSNGDKVRYCNLNKELSIQEGATVLAGDVLGAIGDTADIESALEPHLHIEIISNGVYINPSDVIPVGSE